MVTDNKNGKIKNQRKYLHRSFFWVVGLLCSLLLLVGCGKDSSPQLKADHIKKIDINIINTVEGNTSFEVEKTENIAEAVRVANLLEDYRSPEISTWFVDVVYYITFDDGSIGQVEYENIRPYTDIFSNLFQTLEVRRQREYILYTDIADIENAVLTSPMKGSIILDGETQKELLQKLVISLKEFYNTESVIGENWVYNNAKGLQVTFNNEKGSCLIYAADAPTNALLFQVGIGQKLIVTADDIVSMVVHKNGKRIEITQPELQEIVLANYREGWSTKSEISVEYVLKNTKGAHLDQYGSFYTGQVPQEIAVLFE